MKSYFQSPLTRLWAIGLLLWLGVAGPLAADDFDGPRQRMSAEIAALARETAVETGRREFAAPVMAAIARVPRHRFVPDDQVPYAYDNRPLPIGYGQTISQPYIVALMTDLIDPQPGQTVLEIGTGSGYQAAVLAELVGRVYTIEIIEPLARGPPSSSRRWVTSTSRPGWATATTAGKRRRRSTPSW